jgi:hypothetical protein
LAAWVLPLAVGFLDFELFLPGVVVEFFSEVATELVTEERLEKPER